MLIGYARVSTLDQSCNLQLDALKQAGCARVYKETASGSRRDRPRLQAALAAMRPGDTLVVWRLDRLARSLKHLLETVEGLEADGKDFRSLTEAINTATPAGKLIFQILGALAEFERELIRERTRAGLAAARLRGHRGGRPRALTDADVTRARALLEQSGGKVTAVARLLGVPSSTLYRYLAEHIPRNRTASASLNRLGKPTANRDAASS